MKKLIAVFAVLLFVAPAFAADWAFYGSERVATWYVQPGLRGFPGCNGQDNDSGTQWYLPGQLPAGRQGQGRQGHRPDRTRADGLQHRPAGDGAVNTRRAYGVWKFSDNASLKVGKDYSPVTDFISNQWFDGDNDLLGNGNFYGRRPAGAHPGIGNFEIAFLTPSAGQHGRHRQPPPPAS